MGKSLGAHFFVDKCTELRRTRSNWNDSMVCLTASFSLKCQNMTEYPRILAASRNVSCSCNTSRRCSCSCSIFLLGSVAAVASRDRVDSSDCCHLSALLCDARSQRYVGYAQTPHSSLRRPRQGSGASGWPCLCVCLFVREHISGATCPIFTIFLCVLGPTCGHRPVFLSLRCDPLCTSSVMVDALTFDLITDLDLRSLVSTGLDLWPIQMQKIEDQLVQKCKQADRTDTLDRIVFPANTVGKN